MIRKTSPFFLSRLHKLLPFPQPFPVGDTVCIYSANPETSSSAIVSVVLPLKPLGVSLGKKLFILKGKVWSRDLLSYCGKLYQG